MPAPRVAFPNWSRVALSLLVTFLGYLVGGELHVSEELGGAIALGIVLLGSAGIVPASAALVANLTPGVAWLLTVAVSVAAYVVNVISLDPTPRGILVALLAWQARSASPRRKRKRADRHPWNNSTRCLSVARGPSARRLPFGGGGPLVVLRPPRACASTATASTPAPRTG